MQQTRLAQETFGLPSHVVPTPDQMNHVKAEFQEQRLDSIDSNNSAIAQPQANMGAF